MRPRAGILFTLFPRIAVLGRAERAKEILGTSQGLRGYQGAEPLGWFQRLMFVSDLGAGGRIAGVFDHQAAGGRPREPHVQGVAPDPSLAIGLNGNVLGARKAEDLRLFGVAVDDNHFAHAEPREERQLLVRLAIG